MWYFDYGGANNITNQRPPLSVCTVNTISLSRPPDSAALLQLCGGDGTKGNGSRVWREVRVWETLATLNTGGVRGGLSISESLLPVPQLGGATVALS